MKVLLEKFTVAWLAKNITLFMELKESLPCLQETTTDSYPEPNESIPHPYMLFL
jgi:hypothetical protein